MDRARLTVKEVAERLGVSKQTVYEMLESGKLPGLRLGETKGRHWIITRKAFEEWERTCGTRGGSGGAGLPCGPKMLALAGMVQ